VPEDLYIIVWIKNWRELKNPGLLMLGRQIGFEHRNKRTD
jgi:hypothetical protein